MNPRKLNEPMQEPHEQDYVAALADLNTATVKLKQWVDDIARPGNLQSHLTPLSEQTRHLRRTARVILSRLEP